MRGQDKLSGKLRAVHHRKADPSFGIVAARLALPANTVKWLLVVEEELFYLFVEPVHK